MGKIRSHSAGFTLLEVLLAFAILSAGILAVMSMFPAALHLNQSAWSTTTATFLAKEKMDEILSNHSFISTTMEVAYTDHLPSCSLRWWGSPDPGGNTNLQQVNVEVIWLEGDRSKTISMQSLIAP